MENPIWRMQTDSTQEQSSFTKFLWKMVKISAKFLCCWRILLVIELHFVVVSRPTQKYHYENKCRVVLVMCCKLQTFSWWTPADKKTGSIFNQISSLLAHLCPPPIMDTYIAYLKLHYTVFVPKRVRWVVSHKCNKVSVSTLISYCNVTLFDHQK